MLELFFHRVIASIYAPCAGGEDFSRGVLIVRLCLGGIRYVLGPLHSPIEPRRDRTSLTPPQRTKHILGRLAGGDVGFSD